MQEKFYWQSLSELDNNNSQKTENINEFSQEIPLLNSIVEPVIDSKLNRRDFLKSMGFAVGAASLAAGCSIKERKSVPYVFRPEGIVPGMATYYSAIFAEAGEYIPIMVKNRDGRPIKIEGNKNSKFSNGATNALAQASVIGLYDSKRYIQPLLDDKVVKWNDLDTTIINKLNEYSQSSKEIALFTNSIYSPSTNALLFQLISKYPNIKIYTHDNISYSGLLDATESCFGKRTLPNYHFDKADVIVSIGADFLNTWLNPVEFANKYISRRKVDIDNNNMSKHIQVECIPTATCATADTRFVVSASEENRFAAELYNALISGTSSTISSVNNVKEELLNAKSKNLNCLVVNNSNDKNVQIITYAINHFLGSIGSCIKVNSNNLKKGSQLDVDNFTEGVLNGRIQGIICLNSNPVYFLPKGEELAKKITSMDLSISFAEKIDETSSVCKYICASNNFLESWNDYEPEDSIYSISQPAITNLFNTRQTQQTIMKWLGINDSYYNFIRNISKGYVSSKYNNFDAFWDYTVENGESNTHVELSSLSFSYSNLDVVIGQILADYNKNELEVRFYKSVQGDGTMADNPFVQELPDPITRMTWDNYIIANPKWCVDNKCEAILNEKKYKNISLTINNIKVNLPVVPVAGVAYGVLGIKFGFGRTKVSNNEYKNGENVYKLLQKNNVNFSFFSKDVKIESVNDYVQLGSVQSYFTLNHKGLGGEKTRSLIKETTLEEYKSNPSAGNLINGKYRDEWINHHLVTLYPKVEMPGHQWGMVIDLNSCVGCSACVVACSIENNVPVVGKTEVIRSHDMHWIRIDRYHTGDVNNPDVTFQPMLCQHCDNAPCENVCPVSATNHSSDGINQMAYNRCIGTRYCANNCPYKVRRFNWFDYSGSDSFGSINDKDDLDRLDPIARMVLNPDVVTRSRGVIEKCSFCIQRIQSGKLEAKKANRELVENDVTTACQQVCPTKAISFGDINNPATSTYNKTADKRAFGVIEEIYTKPSVNYLTKVRNRPSNKS